MRLIVLLPVITEREKRELWSGARILRQGNVIAPWLFSYNSLSYCSNCIVLPLGTCNFWIERQEWCCPWEHVRGYSTRSYWQIRGLSRMMKISKAGSVCDILCHPWLVIFRNRQVRVNSRFLGRLWHHQCEVRLARRDFRPKSVRASASLSCLLTGMRNSALLFLIVHVHRIETQNKHRQESG